MYKKNDFYVRVFTFCLFFITFKASPPTPQKCIFTIFLNLPHFIKTLKYSLWNVCALCPQGRHQPPIHQAWSPKVQGTSCLGLGGVGGTWRRTPGHWPPGSPGRGMGVSPGPSSPGPAPIPPPCKFTYLVRDSLNSEVMTPGRPRPRLTRRAPANTTIPGRLLPQLK